MNREDIINYLDACMEAEICLSDTANIIEVLKEKAESLKKNSVIADLPNYPVKEEEENVRFSFKTYSERYILNNKEFLADFEDQTCSPVGAVVGCTQEDNAAALREAYPDIFFLIPGYGAQGGGAKLAKTLLSHAGGTVNSSRGILCAWKKSESCIEKEKNNSLTMADLADAAGQAALESKRDLTQ